MIQKKICMLGTSAVGKTSLVGRFVHSIFSEKYFTSVGVKVDKKLVTVDGTEVMLLIWDLAGDDEFQRLNMSFLRGSSGFLLVADGTRLTTLEQVVEVQGRVTQAVGPVPFILAVNKADLAARWEVDEVRLAKLADAGWRIVRTSAREGSAVDEAFTDLARLLLAPAP